MDGLSSRMGQPDEPRAALILADIQEPGAIERVENEDESVTYSNVLLLAPGVWGDAGSGRHIFYSPEGIENSADNWEADTINLFHERNNEIVSVGSVDTDSVFVDDDGNLYADLNFPRENDASRLADDLLQQALESNGREGIQGPSVELRGEDYRWNDEHGVHELVEGTFNGLGLVGLGVSPGPGSKDAAFAKQTRERAVALASEDDTPLFTRHDDTSTMELDDQLALLSEHGIDVEADDVDEETVQTLLEALELQEDDDGEDDDEDGADDEGGGDDDGEDGDDGADDDGMDLSDVATKMEEIAERVQENSERIESLSEATDTLQDDSFSLKDIVESVTSLSESVEDFVEAERVDEVETQLGEIDERIEELEDEPEDAQSLADVPEHELAQDGEDDGDLGAITPIEVNTYR